MPSASLAVIALHIAVATALAPSPAAAAGALLLAPIYILRKLMGTKATLRSAQLAGRVATCRPRYLLRRQEALTFHASDSRTMKMLQKQLFFGLNSRF